MNLADLEKIFWSDVREQPVQVRLRRVVEALRDEMLNDMALHTSLIDSDDVTEWFNDILGGAEKKAAADAISQTEGEVHDRRISQGVSPTRRGRSEVAGAPEGSGNGAAPNDQRGEEVARAIAGHHEAGRKRDVGSERDHGVTAVKAAGGPTSNDGQDVLTSSVRTPAADPSPAVCEWRMVGKTFATAGCEDEYLWSHEYKVCPSCGKPIAFKEAK